MKITPQQLREKAQYAEDLGYRDHANLLRDAAETIESLTKPHPPNPSPAPMMGVSPITTSGTGGDE